MPAEPICIRRVGTIEEAQLLVDWLSDNDIQATIIDRDNPGLFAFGVTDLEGVAVFVSDPASAERATALLAERDREAATQVPKGGTVTAICEECGASTTFPASQAGTVQDCKECNAYLDVPGGEV